MNKAALILIQVLCLTVFVSAGTGLLDCNLTKTFSNISKETLRLQLNDEDKSDVC